MGRADQSIPTQEGGQMGNLLGKTERDREKVVADRRGRSGPRSPLCLVSTPIAAQTATKTFTPNMDCGDNIVIINAEKVKLTGINARRRPHTGIPVIRAGSSRARPDKILDGAHPERVIEKAVQRMITVVRSAGGRLKNLRVYGGAEHPHGRSSPGTLDVAAMNSKNEVSHVGRERNHGHRTTRPPASSARRAEGRSGNQAPDRPRS